MKIYGSIAALALVAGSSAAQAHNPCPKADPAAVAQTVERFLTALAANDQAKLSTLIAPDFLAFDSGKRYEGMAIANMIGGLNRAGTVVRLSMNDAQVQTRCGIAWVTFVDKGSLTTGDKVREVSWLESAILEHDGKSWRVRFTHATAVAEKK